VPGVRLLEEPGGHGGVSVKETSRLTRTATDAVMPNWYRKRPEMLDMNDTGTKITTRLKVVAMTARPISAVAFRRRRTTQPFSSTKRKMFSSTTMASSMTTPPSAPAPAW